MAEKYFWADKIAEDVIKENKGKLVLVCASGITPSGQVHIGNFREVITTDLVVRALKDKGKNVKFIYSWDDFDRFRKVPSNVSKDYEKYLGMPISDIPSPFEKKGSYAEYFEKKFEDSLKKVGINPHFIRQSLMNKKCAYAEKIKLANEKREDIKKILDKFRKEPLSKDWYPLTIYCEKCNKDFTKVLSVEGYIAEYNCKCGYEGKVDFCKKGIVKAPWRVDWPMRWKHEGVDFEPGGIDHSVSGGSFDTSKHIIKNIFGGKPPIYVFYDWVKIKGGKEFSSSSGNALTLDEVEEIYEPEVLRYLFVGTKPKTGFQISFDNDVIKIYEDYDDLERRYFENKLNPQEKRIYELSQIEIPKKRLEKLSFRHLVTLVQIGKLEGLKKESLFRAEKAKNWVEKYASEDMKFKLNKKVDVKLSNSEKEALLELKKFLKLKDPTEEELFNGFYDICQKVGIKNTDFFKAAYRVIIGKERGPRLANFIISIGREKIIKLLEQIR
jgi:lysyl-tRNA synthetase, class I